MVLDWYHLARTCRELATRICPAPEARVRLLRRLLRALWRGHVSRARRVLVWWQKRRGMQWSMASSDGLAALRTLLLDEGWESYWQGGHLKRLAA